MRRISSLFRSKHADAHSSPPQPLVIPTTPSTPVLTASSNPSNSSASSSGSASVRTPDDDPNSRTHYKKSWLPAWLSSKRSGTLKRAAELDDPPHRSDFVPPPNPRVARPPLLHVHDTDDDLSEESEDDDDDDDDNHHHHHQNDNSQLSTSLPLLSLPSAPEQSRKYLEVITANGLSPFPSSCPLYHHPGTHVFPRSVNLSRLLSHPSSLRVSLLKSHLLHTLQQTPDLSSIDAGLLSTFSTRSPLVSVHRELNPVDVHAVDSTRTSPASHGLKRWIARPCFEDRFVVWLPSQDSSTAISRPVSASYAVAQLEFSEAIEVLAGLDFPSSIPNVDFNPLTRTNTQEELTEAPSPSASSSSSSLSVPSVPRNPPYKAMPSPLRIQHGPSTSQPSPATPGNDTASQVSVTQTSVESETQPPPVKRGVRFAEDDKDDQIPLAYVLRRKKQREEKARFLREERERRAFEEECRKQEAERMERERQRREWERERNMWEMEKKTVEEERKARLYAEEIAASRLRRESARYGATPAAQSGTAPPSPPLSPWEPEDRRRHESRSYTRPAYDLQQRRQASEPSMASLDPGFRIAGSRPSSIGHGGPSPSGSGSRPPSLYSAHTLSSSEDGRLRDAVAAAANGSIRSKKRASVGSLSSQRPSSEHRPSSYSGCYDPIPPVPPVPRPYEIDAPLLPPTPPFMMQQISRPRSSQSSSSGSSKQKMSRPGSADTSQSKRSNVSSSPQRERPSHRRRASGEDPTPPLSERGRTNTQTQSQPNLYSRSPGIQMGMSTSPIPTYFYPPSPWTGVPTIAQLQQQAPMAMAMAFNVRPPVSHRPTVIS